jgi:hypothetical protein
MPHLDIHQEQTVADPREPERRLRALRLMLEHQEATAARGSVCQGVNAPSTAREHPRQSGAMAAPL